MVVVTGCGEPTACDVYCTHLGEDLDRCLAAWDWTWADLGFGDAAEHGEWCREWYRAQVEADPADGASPTGDDALALCASKDAELGSDRSCDDLLDGIP